MARVHKSNTRSSFKPVCRGIPFRSIREAGGIIITARFVAMPKVHHFSPVFTWKVFPGQDGALDHRCFAGFTSQLSVRASLPSTAQLEPSLERAEDLHCSVSGEICASFWLRALSRPQCGLSGMVAGWIHFGHHVRLIAAFGPQRAQCSSGHSVPSAE